MNSNLLGMPQESNLLSFGNVVNVGGVPAADANEFKKPKNGPSRVNWSHNCALSVNKNYAH